MLYWRKDSGFGWRLACEDQNGAWVGRYNARTRLEGQGGVKGGMMEVREEYAGIGEIVVAGLVVSEIMRKQRRD